MTISNSAVAQGDLSNGLAVDDIGNALYKEWDELFLADRAAVESWQLASARRRLEQLAPRVKTLKSQADRCGVTDFSALEDIAPLLFDPAAYKAYPMSLLEKGRFDMLTKWLSGMTSIDLSMVDASGCTGIDDWMALIERETPIRIYHTSGTTGKLSFIPRSSVENRMWSDGMLKLFHPFGSESGARIGGDGMRLPVIFPAVRHGRYASQRLIAHLIEQVAPTPEQCYTSSDGVVSADIVSLSGRIRLAQAKGDLSSITLTEPLRIALKAYLAELERRPEELAAFFDKAARELQGQRVLMIGQANFLMRAVNKGLADGQSQIFAPGSFGITGGGGKDVVLAPNWLELATDYTGISHWRLNYAMSEIIGCMPRCDHGHYHVPPYYIALLLDPETGAVLPREGRRTGRFAMLDLLAQSYWGGTVTGDKVTMEWTEECRCGRKGPYVHDDVTRYDQAVTGDDKITCAATIDNNDAALQALLG